MTLKTFTTTWPGFLFFCFIAPLLFTGCRSRSTHQDAISKYSLAMTQSTESLARYYEILNDQQRAEYFANARFTPTSIISTKIFDAGGALMGESGFINAFPPEAVLARSRALRALNLYCTGIAKIAMSDAPDKVAAELKTLKDPLNSLGSSINLLAGKNPRIPDFKSFSDPIAGIASVIGGALVQKKKDQILVDVVVGATPHVGDLCKNLSADIKTVNDAYVAAAKGTVDAAATYFDSAAAPTDLDKRAALLKEIREQADVCAHVQAADPSCLITDMLAINGEIADFVQSKNTSNDDKVLADLDQFVLDSDRVAKAIARISGASSPATAAAK